MARHRARDKLLPEPMVTQFSDSYMRHRPELVNFSDRRKSYHNPNGTCL